MKGKYFLFGCLMGSAVAIACTDYGHVGELNVGMVDSRDDVGEELMEDFGDRFPAETRIEAVVRFQLRAGGLPIGTFNMPLVKQCDETLEEAYAKQIDSNSTAGGSSGGATPFYPQFPSIPGGCVGDCHPGGDVEVGDVDQA